MTFGFPSLKRYFIGIVITLIIFSVFYIFQENLISISPIVTLLIGLLIGHGIGVLVNESSKQDIKSGHSEAEEVKTLYVGNLSFKTSRHELRELFEPYGQVHTTRIMIDKVTRKPRGYGFVEMDKRGASNAMAKLNGSMFAGRNIKVSEANDRSM